MGWRMLLLLGSILAAGHGIADAPVPAQPVPPDSILSRAAASLAPGEWLELPARNRISDVYPAEAGHPAWGTIGPRAVVVAWNGGVVADGALYVWGGGHRDYGGNEMYRFRLSDLTWERLTDPSPYHDRYCNGLCRTTDGTPTAAHSYDGIEWLPEQQRIWIGSGSGYRSGSAVHQAFLFDPVARRWKPTRVGFTGWLHSDFDPDTGLLLVGSNRGQLAAYDPATGRYGHHSRRNLSTGDRAGALDRHTRRFVVLARSKNKPWQLLYYDLSQVNWDNPGSRIPANRKAATTIADANGNLRPGKPPRSGRMGIAYDPVHEDLVAWDGGRSVWTLDTTTWVWREQRPSGPAPTAHDREGRERTRGVYGRWRYLPAYGVFLGYNDPNGKPWIYKRR